MGAPASRNPRNALVAGFGLPWRKVARDLWRSKMRTVLVVLSIAVGVFAVGSIVHMSLISTRDLQRSYDAVNAADAVIYVNRAFTDDTVAAARAVEGVSAAEGRRIMIAQFRPQGREEWHLLVLVVVPDYTRMQISKIYPEIEYGPDPEPWRGGAWPPPDRQILFERSSLLIPTMGLGGTKLGDTITLQMPSGKQRDLRIAGLAYDFGNFPSPFMGGAIGFVSYDTLEWLGEERSLTELDIRVAGPYRTEAGVRDVTKRVTQKLENGGYTVGSSAPRIPGQLPLFYIFQAITALLGVLGLMALLLTVFLVINTVTAHVGQQIRQIGVIKAIGGRTRQIAALYLGMVAVFGLLATLLAIPAALGATEWFVNFMAYFINFKLDRFEVPPEVIAIEFALGLGVPLGAALLPILGGTRITVREALSSYGIAGGAGGARAGRAGWLRRAAYRLVSRTAVVSVRNTFRRKLRLALTLLTLVLAGTIFVANMTVNASLSATLESALGYYRSDLWISLRESYPLDKIANAARSVPGVTAVEGWGVAGAVRVRPDGSESARLQFNAPPPGSTMINPVVIDGRWLLPDDDNAVVVSSEMLRDEKDIRVGDTLTLTIDNRKTPWRVVGVVRTAMIGPVMYANYPYLTQVTRSAGHAGMLFALTDRHEPAAQLGTGNALKSAFEDAGIGVGSIQTTGSTRDRIGALFTILFTMLMAMTVLMAAVGGLGLMGTMSLNVLERTREIGVLRAIGASNGTVLRIVIVEGVLIGALSWAFSAALAYPLGAVLSSLVGSSMLQSPLEFVYAVDGALLWLVLVVVIAAVASFVPAWHAAHLTVREVLAYEG